MPQRARRFLAAERHYPATTTVSSAPYWSTRTGKGGTLERVYTTEEVADALRISVFTVRRLLNSGGQHGLKVNKDWRITGRALQAFIDAGRPAEHSGSGAE